MKKALSLIFVLVWLYGCPKYDCNCEKPEELQTLKEEAIPKPKAELQIAGFDELEGWNNDNFAEAIPAFVGNCRKIALLKSKFIDNSQFKISTKDYQAICQKFLSQEIVTSAAFRQFISENFVPYLVLDNGNANGKFTSYYETQIHASRHKHGKYKYPVYGKPGNLIELNLHDFDKNLPNRRITGRVEGQKLIPYYTRAEIENSDFEAPVLMWADNLVDIHIMQIQGSATAIMDDGSHIRVGYADNNGHDFRGIGSILLSKGLLQPGKSSMINIKKWLAENPETAAQNMQENNRFIFHRIIEGDGPIGAYGLALTPGRSMAVDRSIIPLGSLLWLNTHFITPDDSSFGQIIRG